MAQESPRIVLTVPRAVKTRLEKMLAEAPKNQLVAGKRNAADGFDLKGFLEANGASCSAAALTGLLGLAQEDRVSALQHEMRALESLASESSDGDSDDSPRDTPKLRPQEAPEGDAAGEPGFGAAEHADPSVLLSGSAGSSQGGSSADDYLIGCEDSGSSAHSEPLSPRSRFDGHPLGRSALELQQEQVAAFHNSEWEDSVAIHRTNRWTVETSAARAKVLVSEAYFMERRHLREQLRWLDTPEEKRPRTFRFGEAFRYPCSSFLSIPEEVLADPVQHRAAVVERLQGLGKRWQAILTQVSQQMSTSDEFPDVIRNLSTMRIFLEGQQAHRYGIDTQQQARRTARYQKVLDELASRGDGLFLKDALPRKGA